MKPLLLVLMFIFPTAAVAQDFEFAVRHHHTLRGCRGVLKFTADSVEYRTEHAKDGRTWKYADLRVIKVESGERISLITYEDQRRFLGKDRVFEFTLLERKAPAELSAFLLKKVRRPLVLAVLPQDGKPTFEFPAKHLHTFGGARGLLRIYADRVVFESSREGDSRIWRLEDIERFGQPDRFRFQITSRVPRGGGPTEVYNFELIEDLPPGAYDYLWIRLHPSTYYHETGAVKQHEP